MESPAFFTNLRAEVLKLQGADQPAIDAWWFEPGAHHDESIFGPDQIFGPDEDGRFARLDELMTQAVLGAGIAITPGDTARHVWVQLVVAYGKTIKSRKQKEIDVSVATTHYDEEGKATIIEQLTGTGMVISAVVELAADYLTRLETMARAERSVSPLISVQKAAEILGLHEDTIRRMQDAGQLGLVRVGRQRRVPKSEVKRLCESGEYPKRRP